MISLASVEQQYSILIADINQPLLVSWGRGRRGQMSTPHKPVFLFPKLCYLTRISHLCDSVEDSPSFNIRDLVTVQTSRLCKEL